MDSESQKKFDEAVRKEPAALSDAEKDFLRARAGYLTNEQLHRFAEVLNSDQSESNEDSHADGTVGGQDGKTDAVQGHKKGRK
jgi:hypothetical protein